MEKRETATENTNSQRVGKNLSKLLWPLGGIAVTLFTCAALLEYSPDCKKSNSPIFSKSTTYTTEKGEEVNMYYCNGEERYFARTKKGYRELNLSEVQPETKSRGYIQR